MTNEFMVASAEILDIFQYLPAELKNKIPDKLIKLFEESAVTNYQSMIDPDKSITDQKVTEKTKTLLSILYLRYWANEEEKQETYEKIKQNEVLHQQQLREKYNPDDLFNNKQENEKSNSNHKEETRMLETKGKFWIRLKNFIKRLLHLKK